MKLYEVPKAIEEATNMIDEDGCISEEWLALLNTAETTLTEKADSIWVILQEKDNKIDSIKKEIDRLTKWKKREERQKEQLKNYLSKNILDFSSDWIQWDIFKFSFLESKSVKIIDGLNIPKKYINKKTVESIDKNTIKELLINWEKIKGAELEIKNNLQIK